MEGRLGRQQAQILEGRQKTNTEQKQTSIPHPPPQ